LLLLNWWIFPLNLCHLFLLIRKDWRNTFLVLLLSFKTRSFGHSLFLLVLGLNFLLVDLLLFPLRRIIVVLFNHSFEDDFSTRLILIMVDAGNYVILILVAIDQWYWGNVGVGSRFFVGKLSFLELLLFVIMLHNLIINFADIHMYYQIL
jgi:hypothetical protein